jgi:hypothetical protein
VHHNRVVLKKALKTHPGEGQKHNTQVLMDQSRNHPEEFKQDFDNGANATAKIIAPAAIGSVVAGIDALTSPKSPVRAIRRGALTGLVASQFQDAINQKIDENYQGRKGERKNYNEENWCKF